jgi:hypothetical protein
MYCLYVIGYRNSLIPFHSKKVLLWHLNVADNNKTYLGFRVRYPIFLPDFNQIWIFSTDLHKVLSIRFHGNTSSGSRADTCGQADMTKTIRAFRHCANAPKLYTVNRWIKATLHRLLSFSYLFLHPAVLCLCIQTYYTPKQQVIRHSWWEKSPSSALSVHNRQRLTLCVKLHGLTGVAYFKISYFET